MEDEPFALRNDAPRPKPLEFEAIQGRQQNLFAGLDCLPGTQDLFPTDGEDTEES